MKIALWVAQGVLGLAFLAAGVMKLTMPLADLHDSLSWTADVPGTLVRLIGLAEVLGALGLVLPALFDTATVLVPLAATGLALVMVGAAVVHARRKETQMIVVNVVLLALAVFVAWGRFGPYAF